jgi:hypothetical protein
MKKKRPQNYLKLVMLVIGVSLLLTTCEREDTDFIAYFPSEQSIEKGYTVKSVNLETVKENELVQESLELISSQFDFNKASKTPPSKNNGAYTTSALADPIKSKDNSFTILTDEILEVSTDSTKVYTFRIETSTKPDSYFENFVIHKKSNDSIDYFIYRYKKIGTTIEHLSMTKEQVNSDQINVGDFKDYTQGLVLYDPGSDCWFDITKQNGILIILIYDCSENGGLGGAGSIGTGGVGGYTSSYIFGGTIPNGQFLFGQWVITGVTPQGNCVINRPLLEMNGSPLRSLEGDLLYESLAVSCPSDSSSNDSSSDDQSWPWDNSSTDSNYDTLHGFGGGGSSTNTDGSDPNNPDEMVVAVLPPTPLELETTAFFDNLTDEQKECLNPGFGQPQNSLKKDITAYFRNNQVFGEIGYDDGPVIADEATAFATAAIEAVCDGGEVDWEELYINIEVLDDEYEETGQTSIIPNPLNLDNGDSVNLSFGTTKDAVNANQEVEQHLIDGLKFALNQANNNLTNKITDIYIMATTNGGHSSTSNHSRGSAIDISRINGQKMLVSGTTEQIVQLQIAFDNYQYIRENFGPHFKHKYSVETNMWDYNYPVGGHKDHIHISTRKN